MLLSARLPFSITALNKALSPSPSPLYRRLEQLEIFDTLDRNQEKCELFCRMAVMLESKMGVTASLLLRTLQHTNDMTLQGMADQTCVSYISREDQKSLSIHETVKDRSSQQLLSPRRGGAPDLSTLSSASWISG